MASRGVDRHGADVIARGNLADPAQEPSDEDLARLMHGASSGPGRAREESLTAMRAGMERLRAEARARFDASRRASGRT